MVQGVDPHAAQFGIGRRYRGGRLVVGEVGTRRGGKSIDPHTDREILRNLISNAVYLLIIIIALFGALSILHLDKTVTSILAGAGIVGLALGFAFQDIAANFISGVAMAVQRPIRTGELVEVAGQLGIVERIDLRTTEIKSLQGLQVIIPNKENVSECAHQLHPERFTTSGLGCRRELR